MTRELLTLASTRSAARGAERLFRRERVRIRRRVPRAIIVHVGATAVRGLPTKGDLDIVVRVEPAEFAQAERALAAMYERNTGSDRTATFAAFKADDRTTPLGVQLVAIASDHDDFDLLTDQLRVSSNCKRKLGRLKRRFAGRPMERYRAAKARVIGEIFEREPLATLAASRRSSGKTRKN
ncbi:MAG: GrpB family protein [Phycisphaerales bacterium]